MPAIKPLLPLLAATLLLGGCDHQVHNLRESRFAPYVQAQDAVVKPSALMAALHASDSGSLTPDSLANLNTLLRSQGRLRNQTLTLRPFTPAGETLARRLASVLQELGTPAHQVILAPVQLSAAGGNNEDLQVVSEAMVVSVPDCAVADGGNWTVKPFQATGTLGCANRANIARMVADPRDLTRAQALDSGDGTAAVNSVTRYYDDEPRELLDIDFSKN
ncbi:CpaD family pilus assembly protein [Pseudomonas sp. MAFF 302030]|jgi:pilus assembly protein CpaD|uniref:CpaD family pilus assembly protein n=1 Tax=Pseudomonas morbosilactucae TaxID=2938197 RepID=A0A9X1YYD6_9PSED|nr:CpaD family pilus assembly lipoprotein [Pseudomonas morbosilactucae]MCK9799337.1 CpaD family pilus assembly protein [Pseudomonas morbosilactucae]MCK9812665.1 CpaD family pilus assembly protein [Pseudomonas morbosilactucae]WEK07576.1 MAG: CpaD family pilus assembly lipoprotein [Pseudomonas sp.]